MRFGPYVPLLHSASVLILAGAILSAKPDGRGPAGKPPGAEAAARDSAIPNEATHPAQKPRAHPAAPTQARRPHLSARTRAEIAGQFPTWRPAPARPAPPPSTEAGVVQMQPFIVRAFQLPHTNEIQWLAPHARNVKLAQDYLSAFDRDLLNRYTLPIVGISQAARARAIYREEKRLQNFNWITAKIKALSRTDPAAAKHLVEIRDDLFARLEP